MSNSIEKIYERVIADAGRNGYAGHDPFDGLNSRIFAATPLKRSRLARLAWLQIVKRSRVDLRPMLRVPPGVNPKGLALFALAETARYRTNSDQRHRDNIAAILDQLSKTAIVCDNEIAFGYNFDWQSRNFFAPIGTPAIVPTAFAQQAYIESYQALGDDEHLEKAIAICQFIVERLNRTVETDDELCFSYTPLDRTQIYNASLLAGECLARVGSIIGNTNYLEMAAKTIRFVVRRQRDDGAWSYGKRQIQAWVDNFHTAYILLSIRRISTIVPDIAGEASGAYSRGMRYWLNRFFLVDGTPKYYDKETYPIDIHSAAVAISTMSELAEGDRELLPQANKIAEWTIANMYDGDGSFYYQIRKNSTVTTSFIRWGQAWMAFAMARLIESELRNGK